MQTIQGYSVAGTGLVLRGIQRLDSGTPDRPLFEVTLWVSLLYLPLVPLRRWKAIYVGEKVPPDMNMDRSLWFEGVERMPVNPLGALRTFALSVAGIFAALAVPYFAVDWMGAETDSDWLMLFKLLCVVGSFFWPFGVVLWAYDWQRKTAEAEEPRPTPVPAVPVVPVRQPGR